MPIQQQGQGGQVAQVDGTFRATRASLRPLDHGALGHYQFSARTGTLAAALAAGAVLFSFRWTDATRLCVLTYVKFTFQTLTVFTAHQEISFSAFVGRGFSASHTGQTAITLTGNNMKLRTNMGTTLLTDARIANTAALGGGTLTLDAFPFENAVGAPNIVNAAAGTAYSPYNQPWFEHRVEVADGESPLVFAGTGGGEGFIIQNNVLWPAAGTGVAAVTVRWAEVATYDNTQLG